MSPQLIQHYISNNTYKDVQMNGSLKIAVILIVMIMIFSSIFYGGKIVSEKHPLRQQVYEYNEARDAFNAAMEMQTISALQDFISAYPEISFTELAESAIERLQFNEVKSENTIQTYTHYLSDYPDGRYSEEANYRKSILINTLAGYESYLLKYPQGNWIRGILFRKARLVDTVEAYNNIVLSIYPDDETVIYYRDKAALEEAKAINTAESFQYFIDKYPKSSWLDTAKYERDKAALHLAKEIGTKKAFGDFVENYPHSAWIDQAEYYYRYGYNMDYK